MIGVRRMPGVPPNQESLTGGGAGVPPVFEGVSPSNQQAENPHPDQGEFRLEVKWFSTTLRPIA